MSTFGREFVVQFSPFACSSGPRAIFKEIPSFSRSLGNGVCENGVCNRVHIDDVGSTLKFRIGFPFGKNAAGFCRSVWLPGSILNFRIGSVSSIPC